MMSNVPGILGASDSAMKELRRVFGDDATLGMDKDYDQLTDDEKKSSSYLDGWFAYVRDMTEEPPEDYPALREQWMMGYEDAKGYYKDDHL
jgi:hypothetical protein